MTKPTLQELIMNTEYLDIGQHSNGQMPQRIICALTLQSGLQVMGEYHIPEDAPFNDYNPFAFDAALCSLKLAGYDFEEPQPVPEPEVIKVNSIEHKDLLELADGTAQVIDGIDAIKLDPNGKAHGYGIPLDYVSGQIHSATGHSAASTIQAIEALTALLKVPRLKANVIEKASNKLTTLIDQLDQSDASTSTLMEKVESNSLAIQCLSTQIQTMHAGQQGLENRSSLNRA